MGKHVSTDIIYVPGFNENLGQWNTLGSNFRPLYLPGHNGNTNIPFSMTATKDCVSTLITKQETKISWIVTYSLSAWPVIQALQESSSAVRKLLLVNPAYDPLGAIFRMYNANPQIQRKEKTLGDVKNLLWVDRSMFIDFLWDGKIHGDTKVFQSDLQKFHDMWADIERNFLDAISELSPQIQTRILFNPWDRIIFPNGKNGFESGDCEIDSTLAWRKVKAAELQAYASHWHCLSPENLQMISNFFNTK